MGRSRSGKTIGITTRPHERGLFLHLKFDMKKAFKIAISILISFVVIIQFVPNELPENSDETSKDIIATENAPEEVKMILKKACYDCHSNQSVYPLYSYIAPFSWLVAKDVKEGREELNFSEWGDLSKRRKIKLLSSVAEEVEKRDMPLKVYTIIHRDAILNDEEISAITTWTKSISDDLLGN